MSCGEIKSVVLIGAGRLAMHLGNALSGIGIQILQVFNRTPENGKRLALATGAEFINSLESLNDHADLYILAVSDSAVPEIARQLRMEKTLVVHTSGTLPAGILETVSPRFGVFYPLQTFVPGEPALIDGIPVLVEANHESDETALLKLADRLSGTAAVMPGDKRKVLHLAAVFACNFPNFMYCIAEDLLKEYEIPFGLLHPLIEQTARNSAKGGVFRFQTGPAAREDEDIMSSHLTDLAGNPGYRDLYQLISSLIIRYKRTNGKL